MAASIEKSRDMQMRNCDVISHNVSGAIIGDDTLRPLATVSPQKGAIYANLCKYRRHRSRAGSRPIRMSPCGAPGDSMTAKECDFW